MALNLDVPAFEPGIVSFCKFENKTFWYKAFIPFKR